MYNMSRYVSTLRSMIIDAINYNIDISINGLRAVDINTAWFENVNATIKS